MSALPLLLMSDSLPAWTNTMDIPNPVLKRPSAESYIIEIETKASVALLDQEEELEHYNGVLGRRRQSAANA